MDKSKSIRYFIYCDVQGVNSIYSQLFSTKQEINSLYAELLSKMKETNSTELAGPDELPYILQGLLGMKDTGEHSRDRYSEESPKVSITIEDKVRAILREIQDDESSKLDSWPDTETLVAGRATFIEYETMASKVERFFNDSQAKYSDFESFLVDTRYSPEFESIWSQFTDFASDIGIFTGSGRARPLSLDYGRKNVVVRAMAIDLRYPVILHFSTDKVLLSYSSGETVRMLEILPEIGVLGILTKAATNLYVLKPLAMWHDLSFEKDKSAINRAYRMVERKQEFKKL